MKNGIFIAGAGGMLGQSFYDEFKESNVLKCTDKDVNDTWLSFLDVRNYDDYREQVIEFSPDYLFHLPAYTDLEYCEQYPIDTQNTNTLSVVWATSIVNELKIPLLYISTAGIFDGKKDLYDETDKPNPLGVYARTKYVAELHVQKYCNDYLIARCGWSMSGGPTKDKKFINKIIKQINSGNKELFIVNDKNGIPAYGPDFAKNVKLLLDKDKKGLYNMVCSGETSRLEVAKEILRILNLENEIKITEVSSDYFSKDYSAERPACERLINKRLNDEGLNIQRDWKVCLEEYLNNYNWI